ncbi:MAG: septation regulator SpoVG [Sphaerochaetaceae bacterium]
MEITDVRVRRITSEGKLRAYATITFDNQFVVHNLKVIDGKSGLFVAMPSRKTKNGEFKDVAHPISSDFRATMQEAILEAYSKAPPPGSDEFDAEDISE